MWAEFSVECSQLNDDSGGEFRSERRLIFRVLRVFRGLSAWRTSSECFQEFDQGAFVGVGEVAPEGVAAVDDEIGTLARGEERRSDVAFHQLARGVRVEVAQFNLGERAF